MRHHLLSVLGLAAASVAGVSAGHAQDSTRGHATETVSDLPVIDATQSLFYTLERADLPGPNVYREATGATGPGYWQQRVDYSIAATLDTAAKSVTGEVTTHYTNNSPDTLRFLWLQVDQNIYSAGSEGAGLYGADSRDAGEGFVGGYTLSSVTVDGAAVTPDIHNTLMRLDLASPLAPHGGKLTIVIRYSFSVPLHGSDRMGRDGTLFELAQWYPRLAVYDDVRGWDTDPYLGQGEFYLEYGNIDYSVTVPAGYVVAGSGILQNASEVLSDTIRRRLARARTDSAVVPIITKEEAAARAVSTPGVRTWRFRAENVRDVAWAAAPDFRWDATSARGVLCQSFYQWPKAGPVWEQVAENTQWTIRTYSAIVAPFPYPQTTSVAGTVSGMEYPMFVMDAYESPTDPTEVFRTNDHEQGHEWFPMMVGSNERRYAWMDEGINTFINAFSQERRYGSDPHDWPRGMDNWLSFLNAWVGTLEAGLDEPLMTMPDHVSEEGYANVGYEKPAAVLLALRDHVVGPQTFDVAFREYVRRWSFKHPTPGDFFRTFDNVTGRDLSWFWREFFYTTGVLDIAVDSVVTAPGDSASHAPLAATVFLRRNTEVVFPVELRLKLADGSVQDVRLPVDIWSRGRTYAATVSVPRPVTGARLWPNRVAVPDVDPRDDVWGDPPPIDPFGPATAGGLSGPVAAHGAAPKP
jgi:hypothetical protein